MTPYEIMLSESQERMLIIVKKGQEKTVRIFLRSGICRMPEVGVVNEDGQMRVLDHGKIVAEIPGEATRGRCHRFIRARQRRVPFLRI
jgi:phosphoribosylformylglycinamidine synthase